MAGPTPIEAWAASGCLALTGRADGPPLGPPEGFVERAEALGRTIEQRAARFGGELSLDVLALLAERAAIAGLTRQGTTSCGGATRLLEAADGWVAVALPRPEDVELLPAWLGIEPACDDPWAALGVALRHRRADDVVGQAGELGLAVSTLGGATGAGDGRQLHRVARSRPVTALRDLVVVDLSSLWAGPLCGALLADAGATVVKVESTRRPDGARRGPVEFHDLLNAGKRSVALDFTASEGRRWLARLLEGADVVIEASRPRALRQLGIDAEELLNIHRPRVWLSITAHGRTGARADRVGFGDDAAAAGGLVAWEDERPRFLADAVADPLTGLTAAATALDLLARGDAWLAELSLAGVAARFAGPTLPVDTAVVADPPRARRVRGRAVPLGADTTSTLAALDGCP